MNKYDVLCSKIPFGGYGRPLTSHEIKLLRKHITPISNHSIVLQWNGSETIGILYKACKHGGFNNTGIKLGMK